MTRIVLDLDGGVLGGAPVERHLELVRQTIKKLVDEGRGWPSILTVLADQIEAQLADPKPAEPMGYAAVVQDTDGLRWMSHRTEPETPWKNPWWCMDLDEFRDYRDVDAVRVLSEGVTA